MTIIRDYPLHFHGLGEHTTSGSDLDVESGDTKLLAADSDILGSQHSSVWRGLVTVGLDLHATRHTGDGFAATGITHVSLRAHLSFAKPTAISFTQLLFQEVP